MIVTVIEAAVRRWLYMAACGLFLRRLRCMCVSESRDSGVHVEEGVPVIMRRREARG